MKFKCPLIVVSDINKSRYFYENLLKQKVKFDFGENITFEGDFAIHEVEHFSKLAKLKEGKILFNTNNCELYFEDDNFDDFIKKIEGKSEINYVHKLVEHPWGQRVVRFYDPDYYIVEVGETMKSVVKRFIKEGYSLDEVSKLTQHPIDFIESCIGEK